jgi:hypothetical protein
LKKLECIAQDEGRSVAEVVRVAIDNYNPDTASFADLDAPGLMDLVSTRLKETIISTQKANRKIDLALKKLSKRI